MSTEQADSSAPESAALGQLKQAAWTTWALGDNATVAKRDL